MASEWREGRLGDFIELHRGYDLPQQNRRPGPVPLVSSSGISDHLAAAMIDGPGVVTGRYGTIGQVFYLHEPFWPLNTTLYVSDFKGNDPRFASYLLRTVDFLAFSDKAAVPGVNRNHVHEAIIRWPVSLDEQKRIAGILGALDDKIELNRCLSQTLESMARALFKSWFVDFDPVRAIAEGRDAGLPSHIADLFPDSFDKSELGTVPSAWPVRSLGDLCSRVAIGPFGSDITVDNFIDSGVPVVRGMNLKDGFLDDRFAFVNPVKADALRNANAFPGDIVITHRGTLGQIGLIPDSSRFPRYVVSQSQMLLSVDRQAVAPQYVYHYLRSPLGQHALLANASQTGVPAIARPTTSLRAIRLLVPPIAISAEFGRMLRPLMDKRNRLASESLSLIDIRNGLLPGLLSGGLSAPSRSDLEPEWRLRAAFYASRGAS